MEAKNFWTLYRIHYSPDDKPDYWQPIARFYADDDNFVLLSDYQGFLAGLEDQPPGQIVDRLEHLSRGVYTRLVSDADAEAGFYPELIPEHKDVDAEPSPVFEYLRTGTGVPQVFTWAADGQPRLDGFPLEPEDLETMRTNLETGRARLRRLAPETDTLAKIEPGLERALAALREAVRVGGLAPEHAQELQRQIFTDHMVAGVGNKKAWQEFRAKIRPGIYISMDGNNFGQINKLHGHEVGDQAIKAMGSALREAMDTAVGSKHGKLFRTGGDELMAWVPSHEQAALFARTARARLEAIPPIGGTHRLSMSMGLGEHPEHSEAALIHAKAAKKAAQAQGHQDLHSVHSLVPGFEGPVPTSAEDLNPFLHLRPPAAASGHAQPAATPAPEPKPGVASVV